ncbi:MAG TPA: hypothetical protein PLZ05_01840 [Alphaproteobacteria bacterium]|nr:hypothetical protein [Alphaproteobacteria bacterium]
MGFINNLKYSEAKNFVREYDSIIYVLRQKREEQRRERLSKIRTENQNNEKYIKSVPAKSDFVKNYFIFDDSSCGVSLKYKGVSIDTSVEPGFFSKIKGIVNTKGLPERYKLVQLHIAISNELNRGYFFTTENFLDKLLNNRKVVKNYLMAALKSNTETPKKTILENRDIIFRGMFEDTDLPGNIVCSDWEFLSTEPTERLAIENAFKNVSSNIEKITFSLMVNRTRMVVGY